MYIYTYILYIYTHACICIYIICHVIYIYRCVYIYICLCIYIHIPYIFLSSGVGTPFTQVTVQWKGQDVLVMLEFDPVAKRFKMRMPEISNKWCWAGEVDEKVELHVSMGTPVLIRPPKKSFQRLHSFLLKAVWYEHFKSLCRPSLPPKWEVAPKANVDLKKPQVTFPKTSVHSIFQTGMTVDEMGAMFAEALLAKHKHNILQASLSKRLKFNPEDVCPLCPEEDHAEHDDNDDDFPCDLGILDADEIDDTLETDLLPVLPPEYHSKWVYRNTGKTQGNNKERCEAAIKQGGLTSASSSRTKE